MTTEFKDSVLFNALSLGATGVYAMGKKDVLDAIGWSYTQYAFSGASTCRTAASAHTTTAQLAVALDTLIMDLKKLGILM